MKENEKLIVTDDEEVAVILKMRQTKRFEEVSKELEKVQDIIRKAVLHCTPLTGEYLGPSFMDRLSGVFTTLGGKIERANALCREIHTLEIKTLLKNCQ